MSLCAPSKCRSSLIDKISLLHSWMKLQSINAISCSDAVLIRNLGERGISNGNENKKRLFVVAGNWFSVWKITGHISSAKIWQNVGKQNTAGMLYQNILITLDIWLQSLALHEMVGWDTLNLLYEAFFRCFLNQLCLISEWFGFLQFSNYLTMAMFLCTVDRRLLIYRTPNPWSQWPR